MYIILGATGHVGSATAKALLDAGQAVTAVTRDASHACALADRGASVAVVDIGDPNALRDVLRSGKRAFLLNPPAAPSTETDMVERESVRNILAALAIPASKRSPPRRPMAPSPAIASATSTHCTTSKLASHGSPCPLRSSGRRTTTATGTLCTTCHATAASCLQ